MVEVCEGKIEGERRRGHERFLGIPFAAPPVGELRFRAPEPAEPWPGVRAARRYGLAAPQNPSPLPGMAVGEQGEDCLTLNVFTPACDAARRPVLAWIHGGAYIAGSAGQALYDGGPLCERGDVVVVTLQYRLGALGYLPVPGGDANRAQLDQIAALRWIRRNIERFGGDPEQVTVFGESAGASAVTTLLAMPAASGLFHRAIAQSGAGHSTLSDEDGDRLLDVFLGDLGLPGAGLEELQALPVQALLDAQRHTIAALQEAGRRLPFGPMLDPDTLPVSPLQAIRNGSARDVPLLAGTNRDEAKLFRIGDRPVRDPSELRDRVRGALRASRLDETATDRLIDAYRVARDGAASNSPDELFDALDSDRMFRIPLLRVAEAQQAFGPRTFVYLFSWRSPARGGSLGACHAIELPFVFGTLDAPGMDRFAGSGPQADALSASMMDAWVAFARTGNPRCAALPDWAPYHLPDRPTQLLDEKPQLVLDPLGGERAAWDGVL